MSGKYILVDRTPVEVDLMTWARELERRGDICAESKNEVDPWRVARSWFADGSFVSTVFLGLDHSFRPGGPPEIFESMQFDRNGECGDPWRCSTWDEALVMHRLLVKDCEAKHGPPVRQELIGVL